MIGLQNASLPMAPSPPLKEAGIRRIPRGRFRIRLHHVDVHIKVPEQLKSHAAVATADVRFWSNSAFAIAPADGAGVEE